MTRIEVEIQVVDYVRTTTTRGLNVDRTFDQDPSRNSGSADPLNMYFTNDMSEGCELNLSCYPSNVAGTLKVAKGKKARVGLSELPKDSVNCRLACANKFNDVTANVFLDKDNHDVYRVARSAGIYWSNRDLPLTDPGWSIEYNWQTTS
ncbi:hypothetical protein AgCh_025852 [Apium graveolens]